jgi:hypothetical protein
MLDDGPNLDVSAAMGVSPASSSSVPGSSASEARVGEGISSPRSIGVEEAMEGEGCAAERPFTESCPWVRQRAG